MSSNRRERPRDHHYALEAASLVLKGRFQLQQVIDCDRNRHSNLLDLDQSLHSVEQFLHGYVLQLLELEVHETNRLPVLHKDLLCKRTGRSLSPVSQGNDFTDDTRDLTMNEDVHGVIVKNADAISTSWPSSYTENVRDLAFMSLHKAVSELRRVTLLNEKFKQRRSSTSNSLNSVLVDDYDSMSSFMGTRKTSEDYLLFRLIVILQLCLVRIQEADAILCTQVRQVQVSQMNGIKVMEETKLPQIQVDSLQNSYHSHLDYRLHSSNGAGHESTFEHGHPLIVETNQDREEDGTEGSTMGSEVITRRRRKDYTWTNVGISFLSFSYLYSIRRGERLKYVGTDISQKRNPPSLLNTWSLRFAQSSLFLSTTLLLRRCWRVLCMNARLGNTVLLVEDWCAQWNLIESISLWPGNSGTDEGKDDAKVHEQRCRRILQLIPVQSTQSSVWRQLQHLSISDAGALRFSFIKWFMNMLYASVGTALQVHSGNLIDQERARDNQSPSFWSKFISRILMSGTAAAAASYYAIVGPNAKSAQVTASMTDSVESGQASHGSSINLLQNTWGMVSLNAVKSLSLQVSRLVKGAAVAERIILGNLPCFILSQSSCPEIAVALKRQRRQKDRKRLSKLNTIFESTYDDTRNSDSLRSSSRVVNVDDYPKRDVIIHLTGGGFFAHTIAGDVPFLLDWSADCKAVVLIPEYSLLPENCFPTALEEITQLYVGLRSGSYVPMIGFHANKIIVTGESSGGNLGAALCVKLCLDNRVKKSVNTNFSVLRIVEGERFSCSSNIEQQKNETANRVRMPDAVMFCCPMLNLSPEFSPSRVFGNADPVLPSSLLLAISSAYIPHKVTSQGDHQDDSPELLCSQDTGRVRKNPLVSPLFTPDDILRLFPPTLLYGSEEDPFLDDSVTFNARLRNLGVDSDLRATRHMAHAFWGLGTAGFPEAIQAQHECREWLKAQFVK